MTFIHHLVPRHDELEQITTEKGRYYQLPNGEKFASVTTVIDKSDFFDKSWLQKWVARIGQKEADKRKAAALRRGEALHRMAEKFLRNDPDYKKGEMPFDLETFIKVREHLALNVGAVFGIELPLYSSTWMTAGKADLIARWKARPSVIDFKTSTGPKDEKDIQHYFVQASVYGLMFNELYNAKIKDIIVILIHDESRYPQIFEEKIENFLPQIETIFRNNKCLESLLLSSP